MSQKGPLRVFWYFAAECMLINPKGPPFCIFWHHATFSERKNPKFFFAKIFFCSQLGRKWFPSLIEHEMHPLGVSKLFFELFINTSWACFWMFLEVLENKLRVIETSIDAHVYSPADMLLLEWQNDWMNVPPLGSSVLEPSLHLGVCHVEFAGQSRPLPASQVLLLVESLLQFTNLATPIYNVKTITKREVKNDMMIQTTDP